MLRSAEFSNKKEMIEDDPTGNWNFSEKYSEQLIFDWFIKCDNYTTIAKFGTSAILEDFQIQDNIQIKSRLRLKALERLADGILRVYKNSIFAIKYPKDQARMKTLKEEIEKYEKELKICFRNIKKDNENTLQINEEPFSFFFTKFTDVLEEFKLLCNKSNLIFIYKPLFDAREHKNKLMSEMVKSG